MARRRSIGVGSTIAGRTLDAEIGRGGMGVVYRAQNDRLDRMEAVKVIADDLARDRSFRERFLREAMIAIAVEHPHVIPVYDADEAAGGHLFIAMRYVSEGWNLASVIGQRGRLEPRLAAQIVSGVASALDAAHSRDLVHRDVKPTNILIVDQRSHHSYLTDFGLSKQVSSKTMSTGAGTVLGTVDYMAPEQAQGREVDLRTDVYALGVTLFEALTGRVPYANETDEGRLLAKVQEPAPMVTQVAPGIPPAFDAVLARALARDPDERYPSAGELGRAAKAAAGRPSSISVPREVGVGSVIADCLIEDVAGEGGMAIVYRARQQSLGREVALKVMATGLADRPEFRARFEREWKIAAALEHPSVVPVLWAGEHDGRLFIVMRFIAGGTLRERLAEAGRLDPEVAVEVLEQVAGALDAAHSRGLVHRDIKPGNVLVDEASGAVYLTDFGLAKQLGDEDITDVGDQVMGTARYMAPERHGGAAVDEVRGDVYSLGCLLWDMLGGTERPRLDTIDAVPSALAAVVDEAISTDPRERFGSAGATAAAARAALAPAGSPAEREDRLRPAPASGTGKAPERRRPFEPAPLSSGLAGRVVELCDSAIAMGLAEGDALTELTAVRDRLTAPLRLAVTGRPGSGRSTLVGALVGRPLAGYGDLAARLEVRHGGRERVVAETASGSRIEEGLTPEGRLPAAVLEPGEVLERVTVELPVEALRTVSLAVGAPGTDADAVLLVVAADEADDAAAVAGECVDGELRATLSAVNCAAALTKADLAGAELPAAIAAVKAALGHTVAAVAAVEGLAATVATTGVPVGEDVALIGELTAAAGESTDMFDSAAAFHAGAEAIAPPEREALLDRYGLAGLRHAFELAAAGGLTGVGLRRRLREVSGLDEVEQVLDGFHQRSDALKADRALDRLEELAYEHAELAVLRDQVEALRLAPEMHLIGLIRAYQRIVVDGVEVPPELLDGLERLITGHSRAQRFGIDGDDLTSDFRAAALAGFRAWKMFENAG
ncbi:MAG TPA: serine/threonine-protein kinase [Solirubrobacterales bacterium]|nr:serine/threonine-protein kinase [Solirubrobacterales bacterium]